jgi:TRAP-type uncharacterized transport system fused permease subunit
LFLTVLYSALAVWMLGLAVPVTASYIIAAVMVAPALVQAGVSAAAAHMFIFYYAVLSGSVRRRRSRRSRPPRSRAATRSGR